MRQCLRLRVCLVGRGVCLLVGRAVCIWIGGHGRGNIGRSSVGVARGRRLCTEARFLQLPVD